MPVCRAARRGDLLLTSFQVSFLIVYTMITCPGMNENGRDITAIPWSTHDELRWQKLRLVV